MEVNFISANNSKNKKIFHIECKNDKLTIAKFSLNLEDVSNERFGNFKNKIENYNSCMIKINNGSIKYNYISNSMIFKQNDLYIHVICNNAPEILRELFCGFELPNN